MTIKPRIDMIIVGLKRGIFMLGEIYKTFTVIFSTAAPKSFICPIFVELDEVI